MLSKGSPSKLALVFNPPVPTIVLIRRVTEGSERVRFHWIEI